MTVDQILRILLNQQAVFWCMVPLLCQAGHDSSEHNLTIQSGALQQVPHQLQKDAFTHVLPSMLRQGLSVQHTVCACLSCMAIAAGLRHSRRLAALTEAEPGQPTSVPVSNCVKHEAAVQEASQEAASRVAVNNLRGQAGQQQPAAQLQSLSLLQASTLEASANVLKGLVNCIPCCCMIAHLFRLHYLP